MADNKKIEDENEKLNLITLTDEDSGEDKDFEVIATAEIDGKVYYALIETDEENDEYINQVSQISVSTLKKRVEKGIF